jgi:hypothetical protein
MTTADIVDDGPARASGGRHAWGARVSHAWGPLGGPAARPPVNETT